MKGRDPVTHDNHTRAVLAILISALSFALVGMMVKFSGTLPVYEKALIRSLVSLAIMGAVAFHHRDNPFRANPRIPTLIVRGAFGTGAMLLYFYAIGHLTLADATLLNKLSPFFVIVFAVVFLKEKLPRYIIPSLVIAFAGAALVIKPQLDFRAVPAVAGIVSAICSGAAYVIVRSLKGKEPPYRVVFYFALVAVAVTVPPTLLRYVRPTLEQLGYLIAAGVFATVGQFSLTYGYHQSPASKLSIYNYAHVIFALVIGLVFWGEIPDWLSLVGGSLIIAAAIHHHRRALRDRGAPPPT
jgi:drug/metabolite transporter (DMT)-like permease